jgi:hypothetical protein
MFIVMLLIAKFPGPVERTFLCSLVGMLSAVVGLAFLHKIRVPFFFGVHKVDYLGSFGPFFRAQYINIRGNPRF